MFKFLYCETVLTGNLEISYCSLRKHFEVFVFFQATAACKRNERQPRDRLIWLKVTSCCVQATETTVVLEGSLLNGSSYCVVKKYVTVA